MDEPIYVLYVRVYEKSGRSLYMYMCMYMSMQRLHSIEGEKAWAMYSYVGENK